MQTSSYDLSDIKNLPLPLRPIFVSPASNLELVSASAFPQYFPVVCLSASMLAEDAKEMEREHGFIYVQGAGDDHELWSKVCPDHSVKSWIEYNLKSTLIGSQSNSILEILFRNFSGNT